MFILPVAYHLIANVNVVAVVPYIIIKTAAIEKLAEKIGYGILHQ